MLSIGRAAFLVDTLIIRPRFIDGNLLSYLVHQIGSGNPIQIKNALQELCKLYRNGYRIIPDNLFGVENSVVGLIHTSDDSKVRRWALNALAQLGKAKECKSAVLFALEAYAEDTEVVAAGLAALYKISANPRADLRKLAFSSQVITLAALQHVPAQQLDLSSLPVKVDTATSDMIKLGLVVVGLNRAPPHMFDPDHGNAAIVRAVGNHHDRTVAQYSVWAITENPTLGIGDLGIDLREIESLPENVRGWVFQLLAMDAEAGTRYVEYIELGSKDSSATARAGLALGLKDTFSDNLVQIVLEWFTMERDPQVRRRLTDHLIAHAGRSTDYREHALGEYQRERFSATVRDRMLGRASGSALFAMFKKIDHSDGDLFGGDTIVNQTNNNNVTFGNVQAGAIAGVGSASNVGSVSNQYSAPTIEAVRSRLSEVDSFLSGLQIPQEEKQELAAAIAIAKADTSQGNVGRVVSGLTSMSSLVTEIAGAGEAIHQLVQGIVMLIGSN